MNPVKPARGVLYLSVSSLAFMLSGYAVNVFLGRALGPVQFGSYSTLMAVMTLINVVQSAGIPQAAIRYSSQNPEESAPVFKSALRLTIVSNIAISLVLFGCSSLFAHIMKDQSLVAAWRLLSFVFPFYGVFVLFSAVYNGRQQFWAQAKLMTVYSVSKLFAVTLFTAFAGLKGALVGYVISPLIAVITGYFSTKATESFPYVRLLRLAIPLTAFAAVSTVQISIDVVLLKTLAEDNRAAGLYSAAQNISRIPYFALAAFGVVVFPVVSQRLAAGKLQSARNMIATTTRYVTILLIPGFLLLASTAKSVLHLFYGSVYVSAENSLRIQLLAYSALAMFSLLANIMNASNLQRRSWIYSGIGIIVALPIYVKGIPVGGVNGAAFGTLAGGLVSLTLAALTIHSKLNAKIFHAGTIVRSTFASVIASLLLILATPHGLLLIPSYLIAACLYLGILYALHEFTEEDFRQIWQVLPKRPLKGKAV